MKKMDYTLIWLFINSLFECLKRTARRIQEFSGGPYQHFLVVFTKKPYKQQEAILY